jgi:hypothetical protein
MLFLVDTKQRTATPAEAETFSTLGLTERYDLQEWVLAQPSLLGEDLLVVTSEFNQFDRTAERLDVLMLDRAGKLVVVELKRSAVGTAAELQGLRYAAYCSALSFDDVVEMYTAFHAARDRRELSRDEARSEILDFVADPDFEELDDKPRIILAAEEFPPEITATLLWLRTFEVDISAVRLRLYRVGEQLALGSSMLIPLPEAEERGRGARPRSEAGATSEPRWLSRAMVLAIHADQIEQHGGSFGLRDLGLLESALERPRHRRHYDADADLAAA